MIILYYNLNDITVTCGWTFSEVGSHDFSFYDAIWSLYVFVHNSYTNYSNFYKFSLVIETDK